MNCSIIRRFLSAYCDAELPAERRAIVRRHLQHCDECRTLLDGFKSLAVLTANWCDLQPRAALWQTLASKLKVAAEAACATAAAQVGSGDPRLRLGNPRPVLSGGVERPAPSAGASPRRTFKPVLEGLEDRQTLSSLLGAAGMAVAADRFASAVAILHVNGDWSATRSATADFSVWQPIAGALCVPANADVFAPVA